MTDDPLGHAVRVLLLEDSDIDAELLAGQLRRAGPPALITRARGRQEFLDAIAGGAIDIILADYALPSYDGLTGLDAARERLPDVPVIIVSGVVGEEFATEALQRGASDYVLKRNLMRLPAAVERALAEAHERVEHRRAEAALQHSEVRTRLAVAAARLGTWDLNPDTGTITWITRVGGAEQELEFDYTTFLSRVHADDRVRLDAAIRAASAPGGDTALAAEYRTVTRSGTLRWMSIRAQGLRADGRCTRLVGVVQDITEQKATAAALEQEVRLRTRERDRIWQLSRDLLVVCDRQLASLLVNPAWTELLGWTEAELLAARPGLYVHPDDLPALLVRVATLFAGEQRTLRHDCRLRRKDGTYRWFSWTAVPDDGLLYAIGRDVTDDKTAAEQLAAVNRQLLQQIDERERVEATLRQMQRLEAVGQLTSGVAHDFNNLLTVILGNASFLERELAAAQVDEQSRRRLAQMQGAATRGAQLTAQLLAFSRRQRLEPKPVGLNETVLGMQELLHSTMGGAVRITTLLQPALWRALVDPTQIELIILNLAINARDAMEVGGSLTVSTANVTLGPPQRLEEPGPGDYVMLSLADTGTGMTESVLTKAFEPFFTTKEVGKGSGLGLAQVYGFAKQSGGGVRIDTRLAQGTTVQVFLPRACQPAKRAADQPAAGPVAAQGERAPPPVARRAPGEAARRRAILLVDDDNAVREITAAMLDDLGYDVVEAAGGTEALDALDREPGIALLLVDYAMPGMNGVEAAQQARARRPGLPVLFVTGYADLGALKQFGDKCILQKPFRERELAERVRAALEPAAGEAVGLPRAAGKATPASVEPGD